jgi:predicted ATPase
VVRKQGETGNDYFKSETTKWNIQYNIGPLKSALAGLPEDLEKFPVARWFRNMLQEGVQRLVLNAEALRRPAKRSDPRVFSPDGSNLPWVVNRLEREAPVAHRRWVQHVQTALPDLQNVTTVERPEDRARYLVVGYEGGLQAPAWSVSDGTLRLLALTLIAYLPAEGGVLLVEEPENGMHPQAVETVFQSLSSVYAQQVFCASHSPVLLSLAKSNQLLCFAKDANGAVDIVRGEVHPRLKAWRGAVNLGDLLATGVLG